MKRSIKRTVLCALLTVSVLVLSGCGGRRLMMGTGGTSGTYYAFGGVLSQYMKNYTDYNVTAVSTAAPRLIYRASETVTTRSALPSPTL